MNYFIYVYTSTKLFDYVKRINPLEPRKTIRVPLSFLMKRVSFYYV